MQLHSGLPDSDQTLWWQSKHLETLGRAVTNLGPLLRVWICIHIQVADSYNLEPRCSGSNPTWGHFSSVCLGQVSIPGPQFPHQQSEGSVSRSVMSNSVTPWTVACQAPLFMEFSRQEYWSGLPFLFLGDLPDPGIEPRSPTLWANSLPFEPAGGAQVRETDPKLYPGSRILHFSDSVGYTGKLCGVNFLSRHWLET